MLRVGLVGYGYWGENLARNISRCEEAKLVGLSEISDTRCELFRKLYPNAPIQHYDELIKNSEAIVIATPPSSHYDLAMQAIKAGRHVFVEKPMCLSSNRCHDLIEEAEKRKTVLAVDHTFVHSPAVQKIGELIRDDEVGHPLYYDSARVNLGAFQKDCDVVWDLAVHDLAIIDYLLSSPLKPLSQVEISARTFSHYTGQSADQAFINLSINGFNAHLNVSWSSPVKLRHVLIGCSGKMIVYDDIEPDEKVKVYDRGIESEDDRVSYRQGDVYIPKLFDAHREALLLSLEDFVHAVHNRKKKPLVDGFAGMRVVYLLEMISKSAVNDGATLKIKL